jgi:hypothetical protein
MIRVCVCLGASQRPGHDGWGRWPAGADDDRQPAGQDLQVCGGIIQVIAATAEAGRSGNAEARKGRAAVLLGEGK